MCTALCLSLISIFKQFLMRKFVRARDGRKSKILFENTLKPRVLYIHERFDFMKFIDLKCDVSFHVWQIILIFGCKLMIFLLLPMGKKRHFTNYYGAGQRHLCLLASVLAWHIGPLTQMPEEGKERGPGVTTLFWRNTRFMKSHSSSCGRRFSNWGSN